MNSRLRTARNAAWRIGPVILILALAGCASRRPTPQAGPNPNGSPGPVAPAAAGQTLTDQQIELMIQSSGLSLVRLRRESIACAIPAGPVAGGGNGFPPGNPLGNKDPYEVWLAYIADHIRTNTSFGADYAAVSAGALQVDASGWTDPTGEVCLNFRKIKDVDLLRAIAEADPAKIGERLLNAFSPFDQSTRDRVARLLPR